MFEKFEPPWMKNCRKRWIPIPLAGMDFRSHLLNVAVEHG